MVVISSHTADVDVMLAVGVVYCWVTNGAAERCSGHLENVLEIVLSLHPFHRYGGNAAAVALPPGLVGSDPMSPSARLLPTASMAVLNTAVTVEVVVDDAPLTEHVQVREQFCAKCSWESF